MWLIAGRLMMTCNATATVLAGLYGRMKGRGQNAPLLLYLLFRHRVLRRPCWGLTPTLTRAWGCLCSKRAATTAYDVYRRRPQSAIFPEGSFSRMFSFLSRRERRSPCLKHTTNPQNISPA